jgi:photosystem II stability/assembly factor-like uncharacterized protein
MFNPTISPLDTDTVLISCDMTGSYITHDAGKNWRMFSLRGVVDFFVFDPKDPKTMYAHATALWRSTDAGEHWELVYPAPDAVKGVKMASDHADEIILADPDPGMISRWRSTYRSKTLRDRGRESKIAPSSLHAGKT